MFERVFFSFFVPFGLISCDAKIARIGHVVAVVFFKIGVFAMDWVQKVDIAGLFECRYFEKVEQ